jgi:hypothetical protein
MRKQEATLTRPYFERVKTLMTGNWNHLYKKKKNKENKLNYKKPTEKLKKTEEPTILEDFSRLVL